MTDQQQPETVEMTVHVKVGVKDVDAARLAAAWEMRPEGATEGIPIMPTGDTWDVVQAFLGMQVSNLFTSRPEIFDDPEVVVGPDPAPAPTNNA